MGGIGIDYYFAFAIRDPSKSTFPGGNEELKRCLLAIELWRGED